MSFALHQVRKQIAAVVLRFARSAAFVASVLIGGLSSSCYMVDAGTRLTTDTVGPWVTWTAAARTDADPYTRAHFARLGMLPLSTEAAYQYLAVTDDEGRRLHSSCEYEISGHDIPSHWWSITVFDGDGNLIANSANRQAFTSDTVALHTDGTYTITLARDARPENWLPTGGAGRLAVTMQLLDLGVRAVARDDEALHKAMPAIKRSNCR